MSERGEIDVANLPLEYENAVPSPDDMRPFDMYLFAASLRRAVRKDSRERREAEREKARREGREGLEVVHIAHNSPEWLEYRKTGIGGSDAAVILGLSSFKSNVELWEEKVGLREPPDISDKPQVRYGKNAEDVLRDLFALDHPQYLVTSDKYVIYRRGCMFASLDGELEEIDTGARGIYEGKTAELHRRTDLEKWDGRVPDAYYVQLLHYFLVTGCAFAVLKAQLKLLFLEEPETVTRHYRFTRAELAEDLEHLKQKEQEFWGYVERRERPPCILPRI